jgi:hypothetical protein
MVRDCPGGVCECGGSLTSCGALCVDTESDTGHCGTCGNACGPQPNAAAACVAGACALACNPGWDDCDHTVANGCESDISWDAANCGACGNVCGTNLSCVAGTCLDITELRIDNPNGVTIEYLPRNEGNRNAAAEGTCTGDCTVHPTNGNMGGVRLRSPTGFASGCDQINRWNQCYVNLPGHVVIN